MIEDSVGTQDKTLFRIKDRCRISNKIHPEGGPKKWRRMLFGYVKCKR
jgi:hypothetical protein